MLDTSNPHRIHRYRKGGAFTGGREPVEAAKCRCGWEGEGHQAILEHQGLVALWEDQHSRQPTLVLARSTDPETSQEAAQPTQAKEAQRIVLLRTYLAAGPAGLTDEEASHQAGLADGGWKRCSDLRTLGLITWTDEHRLSTKGRRQRVHRITPAGVHVLEGPR